jgi:hypothetical protein
MTDDGNEAREIAYLALGRLIAGQCPRGFQTAALRMEIEDGRTKLWIEARLPDGTELHLQPDEAAARDMLESLRGIRQAMEEEDGRAWRRCTVTLRAGGHFAIDVDYPPRDGEGDQP